MKTCEVHEIMLKNQMARFNRKSNDLEYFLDGCMVRAKEKGEPDCKSVMSTDFWKNHDDWELVPREVTWQEAIQAWLDGKRIRCSLDGLSHTIIKSRNFVMSEDEFKEGKWYIE